MSIEVESPVGIIEGFIDPDIPNVAQFLGIPYGKAPVGPLRWEPPQAKGALERIKALSFGPSCWQPDFIWPSIYSIDVPQFNSQGPRSEDCLSVCVFSPLAAVKQPLEAKIPVIVWIHGGGHQVGGSDTEFENPKLWVARSEKHIVVKVNYRLNIFGFPNAAGLTRGQQNLAILDIRLALEWVRANIASFGGDALRIILWGQSGGGMLTDYYNYAYPEDSVVAGVILNSGNALMPWIDSDPNLDHSHFSHVAKGLGFEGDDPTAELDFMRSIDPKELVQYVLDNPYIKNGKSCQFLPIIDEVTIFRDYAARTSQGKLTRKPAIIGVTSHEGSALAGWKPDNIDEQFLADANQASHYYFWMPAENSSVNRLSANIVTYRFLYDGDFPNISRRPWQKAFHAAELPMIHGAYKTSPHGPTTAYQEATSAALQDAYLAFAEDPNGGLEKIGWNAWKSDGEGTKIFGTPGAAPMVEMSPQDVAAYVVGIEPPV